MDNYIVRIYRRNGNWHGLVENIEHDLQKQFHSKEELWQLLEESETKRSQQGKGNQEKIDKT